jgi:hypothetical protein
MNHNSSLKESSPPKEISTGCFAPPNGERMKYPAIGLPGS